MHYRSFFLGWGTAVFALGCATLGLILVVRAEPISFKTKVPVIDLEQIPLDTAPVVEVLVSPQAATGTKALHEPPLGYLSAVNGDPKLAPHESFVRVPVLMYHRIREMKPSFTSKDRQYSVTPEHFEAQMEALVRAGYTTITPRQLEEAIEGKITLSPKSVLLTFDDGYREHATIVLPILKRLHLKATYFIITSVTKVHAHMTEDMIRQADATGLITLADHTSDHPFLARMSKAARVPEIAGSKTALEKIAGHPILDFAYPFGSWSYEVADDVKNAGYHLGFGVRLGSVHAESSRYQLRRIRVLDGENVVSLADQFSKP